MKRIFISHASSDVFSDVFIDSLSDSIRKTGFDVLVDKQRLHPGASWRKEIYTWLSVCHAAVVLLSPRALQDSLWVPREMSLLIWRKVLDPKLTIIPVLCPGVTLEDIESNARFRDLQIRELQAIKIDEAEAAVRMIVAALERSGFGDSTPFDELVEVIVPLLSGIEDVVLEDAAELVAFDLSDLQRITDPRRRLAFKMLGLELEALKPILDFLFARARGTARSDLADIISILAANWVDPGAAQWVARESAVRLAGRPARQLLLNASSLFAAEMYVQRAGCRPPHTRWPTVPITGVSGNESSAEIADEIEHALAVQFPLPPDPFQPDVQQRRKRQLKQMQRMGIPIFFVMRLPPTLNELAPLLERRFGDANVIFLTGDDELDPAVYPDDRFRMVVPPLTELAVDDAQAVLDSYRVAYHISNR